MYNKMLFCHLFLSFYFFFFMLIVLFLNLCVCVCDASMFRQIYAKRFINMMTFCRFCSESRKLCNLNDKIPQCSASVHLKKTSHFQFDLSQKIDLTIGTFSCFLKCIFTEQIGNLGLLFLRFK